MSISSSLISKVAIWRNPLGSEENWLRDLNRDTRFPSSTKIRIAGVAFAAIMVVAIIESIVNAIFTLLAKALTLFKLNYPFEILYKRLDSSVFSISWACALLIHCNVNCTNLCTTEYSASQCYPATLTASAELQGKARDRRAI